MRYIRYEIKYFLALLIKLLFLLRVQGYRSPFFSAENTENVDSGPINTDDISNWRYFTVLNKL